MSKPFEDPFMWASRLRTKLHSLRLKATYPFHDFGSTVSIHHSCEILRSHSSKISLGNNVLLDREVWLNVPEASDSPDPTLRIGNRTNIGRRSVLSGVRQIHLEENVLLAPAVFITDHNHAYDDPNVPISDQGIIVGGTVLVEKNCWLGYGSMVIASKGNVVIGRNSVVAAYSVVTQSCPPFSLVVGVPGQVIKRFDPVAGKWISTRPSASVSNE